MKYAGNITILDDQGEAVFERELSADEIIEQLLTPQIERILETGNKHGIPAGDRRYGPNRETVSAEVVKRKYKKRETPDKGAAPAFEHKLGAKSCCGSMGRRHKKDCPVEGDAAPAKVDHGRVLTEEEFDTVKELRGEGKNTLQIRGDLGEGCSFQQINWAILSATYMGYLEHAKQAR